MTSCGIFKKELIKIIKYNECIFDLVFLDPSPYLDRRKLNDMLNKKLEKFAGKYDKKIVIYGKCSPEIDKICSKYGAERIKEEHLP